VNAFIRVAAAYVIALIFLVGALGFAGASATIWIGGEIGYGWASLIVAGGFLAACGIAAAYAAWIRDHKPAKTNPVGGTALALFEKHPFGVIAGAGLLAFLIARRPSLLLRSATLGATLARLLKD